MKFIQILFSFNGRINRSGWWLLNLPIFTIFAISAVTFDFPATKLLEQIHLLILLVLALAHITISAKRWQDKNRSALWLLLHIVPLICSVSIIAVNLFSGLWVLIHFITVINGLWTVIELGLVKGTEGSNQYGPDSETSSEAVIDVYISICGISSIIFVFGIFFFVFKEGASFLFGGLDIWEFLTSEEWYPTSLQNQRYGTFALILGTFSVTVLAMLLAVPFGLGAAIYVSEFCSPKLRETFKIVIEFLAAIPSVVWGFIGLTLMNQLIIQVFNVPIGLTMLNGGIMLALMSVPIIVSIAEDALKAVPDSYREAAEAMGATRWQIIYRVLLPAAKNGLLAAVLLGAARSIGETMAVLMATGHSVNIPSGPLSWIRTLTATIAAELGEVARGGEHYQVLFIIGILLFSITFVVNLIADLVIKGIRQS
ncbi:MAG: phosphate ABC transporter permease subunit PstC [Candidatus Poribacteria bacterium]|nr:phosphate ABC transporter permease subunit PstC [Candidatus Poribacteria bacterium]